MNTIPNTTDLPIVRLALHFDPAPATGSGSMPAEQDRTFSMLAHLFPLVFWFWKRKESPAVDAHGKEALNFGITMLLATWPLGLIASFLGSVVATVVSIALGLVGLATLALVVVAMLKSREGLLLRYPVNFRFIK